MKKLFLCVLALAVCVSAAENLGERVDGLQAQIERIVAKSGISFGGEFRSQFLSSTVSGDAVDDASKVREGVEYTSVDFDIVARPNTALSARAVFRLHQDWRNFFSDVQNPITTRWLSIDGSLQEGIIKYSLGDYRKKLTPLTLWAPEIDLLYEPEIFAQSRRLAMDEAFLGENERGLQGGTLSFKAEVYPILRELEADFFGARLSTVGTKESQITSPGLPSKDADYDRYLLGANLATQIIDGAGLGVSYVTIFDNMNSYDGDSISAKLGSASFDVVSVRANIDNRIFMNDDFINVGIKGEAAFSNDKWYNDRGVDDDGDRIAPADTSVSGMAINAGLFVRVALGEDDAVTLSADYIHNDEFFRNDAAQSPTFMQTAIMNNENSLAGMGAMNPFDAMYRSVFKYVPSQYYAGGTLPYKKIAYNNSLFKPGEAGGGSVFQSALPGGMATADRTGPVVNFKGSLFDKGITVGAKGAMLKNVDRDRKPLIDDADPDNPDHWSIPTLSEYKDAAVGLGVDIAKFLPFVGPSLKISASYGMYDARHEDDDEVGDFDASESTLWSGEVNYNFFQRFSFLFGYQQLTTVLNRKIGGEYGKYIFENMAFGLNYKVADGGSLTFKITMLSGTDEYHEYDDEAEAWKSIDYKVFQPELFLTVRF